MTWADLATENLRAARTLLRAGHSRASITRSYYAVYCAITSEIFNRNPSIAFKHGRSNPPHEQLNGFVLKSLGLDWQDRSQIDQIVRTLLRLRIDADYRPEEPIPQEQASVSISDAESVLTTFGVAIL